MREVGGVEPVDDHAEVVFAEEADQGGQDAAPLLAEDAIERRYQYTSEGRISTAPP
jgi:hypothetical protein